MQAPPVGGGGLQGGDDVRGVATSFAGGCYFGRSAGSGFEGGPADGRALRRRGTTDNVFFRVFFAYREAVTLLRRLSGAPEKTIGGQILASGASQGTLRWLTRCFWCFFVLFVFFVFVLLFVFD